MRILLIDDDKDLCALTQKALTVHGYLVDAFSDPQAGITHAQASKPDLILMDIMLPGLSGPEIVQSFKQDVHLCGIPVVFLTGLVSGNDTMDEGIMVGGVMYDTLGKPYEVDKLLSTVKKYGR